MDFNKEYFYLDTQPSCAGNQCKRDAKNRIQLEKELS